jgi:hypothetical protein
MWEWSLGWGRTEMGWCGRCASYPMTPRIQVDGAGRGARAERGKCTVLIRREKIRGPVEINEEFWPGQSEVERRASFTNIRGGVALEDEEPSLLEKYGPNLLQAQV